MLRLLVKRLLAPSNQTKSLGGTLLLAREGHDGKPITLIGQVVDTGCYIHHDSKGADHVDCAKMCAKAGVPLAILDDKGEPAESPPTTKTRT